MCKHVNSKLLIPDRVEYTHQQFLMNDSGVSGSSKNNGDATNAETRIETFALKDGQMWPRDHRWSFL